MKIIISPAKNMKNNLSSQKEKELIFSEETRILLQYLQKLSCTELQEKLHISEKLATLNYDRYQNYNDQKCYSAIELFDGLVFKNLRYETLSDLSKNYLQKHVLIYSAFYGILRPEDAIRPYRLDMIDNITDSSQNLYPFWDRKIFFYLKKETQTIINLASKEYSKMIEPYLDETIRYITITFKVMKNQKLKTESTSSKMMRGYMLRYLAQNNIEEPEKIKNFHDKGYRYVEGLSSDKEWIFVKGDES